jgi:hypothetical protein
MTRGQGLARTDVDVRIGHLAAARAAAGCERQSLTRSHVGDVRQAAPAAHTGLGVALAVSTILQEGRPVTASRQMSLGTTLEALPPFPRR